MLYTVLPLALLIALGLCAPAPVCRLLRFVERPFCLIARQRFLAVVLSGLVAFIANATLALFGQLPKPQVHDEFSYLLQADTFAHGRLANPPHPLWAHFETMHVIGQPTYASKYPPAQGLMLALGQVTCGQPIVGVWLSGALASAAICWMLLGYLRPRWATMGGMLSALHPLMFAWSQNYWGGAISACGGALLLGAATRIGTSPRPLDAVLLGLGMAILANSRPFEGLVLTVLVLAPLLSRLMAQGRPVLGIVIGKIVLPASIVLLPVLAWMGYYNWRVTGHALRMPFVVYTASHDVAPKFLWQSTRPEPSYQHKELRDLHVGWELPFYEKQQTLAGFVAGSGEKLEAFFQRYFPLAIFQLPILAFPWLLAQRTRRSLLVASLFLLVLLVSEVWILPHYAAPVTGLLMLLVIQGLRILRLWSWRARPSGRFLVRTSLLMSAVLLLGYCRQLSDAGSAGWNVERARILDQLTQQPGRHLVLVHYGPNHVTHAEWVYNEADIDNAKVVWARDMGSAENRELLKYFADRTVWVLEADAEQH